MESHVIVVIISFLLLFMAHRCARNEFSHMGIFRVTPKDCAPRCILAKGETMTAYLCCGQLFEHPKSCEYACKEKKSCCKI
ncbi:hypothetical protein Hanom_Chr16g01421581 [Helianthus anomalus]